MPIKIGQIYYHKREKEHPISSLTVNIKLGTFTNAIVKSKSFLQTTIFVSDLAIAILFQSASV
ncbi:hypothetical protein C7B65_12460 [Phormidesmis priestleyi ULC007]|uniref:Uncharacterized protein n=1 Tax=Phormidesmis priestleyi ULC007 TaxID=1920490 RepID=A0A2T1DF75_9CYAN|nr:hypothetical protein [Phormidesmis priestleyi]PSB19091.1 hypothetical protein C7B65_12460 [Phormidesmis priestleyi ULC007]PZO49943.1 MAG: hypothetical protein DCF14_12405 [Phormidesmis priestleyi]